MNIEKECDDFWDNEEDHQWAQELIKRNEGLNNER